VEVIVVESVVYTVVEHVTAVVVRIVDVTVAAERVWAGPLL